MARLRKLLPDGFLFVGVGLVLAGSYLMAGAALTLLLAGIGLIWLAVWLGV